MSHCFRCCNKSMNEIVQSLIWRLKIWPYEIWDLGRKLDLGFGQMIEIYLLKDLRFAHHWSSSMTTDTCLTVGYELTKASMQQTCWYQWRLMITQNTSRLIVRSRLCTGIVREDAGLLFRNNSIKFYNNSKGLLLLIWTVIYVLLFVKLLALILLMRFHCFFYMQ